MSLNKFEEVEVNEWYIVVLCSPEGAKLHPPFIARYLGKETEDSTHEGWKLLAIDKEHKDYPALRCFDVIRYVKIPKDI